MVKDKGGWGVSIGNTGKWNIGVWGLKYPEGKIVEEKKKFV